MFVVGHCSLHAARNYPNHVVRPALYSLQPVGLVSPQPATRTRPKIMNNTSNSSSSSTITTLQFNHPNPHSPNPKS